MTARTGTGTKVTLAVGLALLAQGVVAPAPLRAQARQGLLSLDDARLFYEVTGTGEPIIVIHGGPGLDHAYLRPGLDALTTRNTLIYYDQRGTGRSTSELTATAINLDTFVEDIDALRQVLGFERIGVLGHSFGALLAIEYAARHPESTRALILMNPVEPGSRFAEETAERQRSRRTAEDAEELAQLRGSEAVAARDPGTLGRMYRLSFRAVMRNPDRVDELSLDLASATARNGQDVAALLGASMQSVDWWDRLASIAAPTLVLQGRYDAPPLEMGRTLAEAFPSGTYEVLDSGHFPYLEDREGLLAAVSGFYAGLR
jgi:proline iminopeptidase